MRVHLLYTILSAALVHAAQPAYVASMPPQQYMSSTAVPESSPILSPKIPPAVPETTTFVSEVEEERTAAPNAPYIAVAPPSPAMPLAPPPEAPEVETSIVVQRSSTIAPQQYVAFQFVPNTVSSAIPVRSVDAMSETAESDCPEETFVTHQVQPSAPAPVLASADPSSSSIVLYFKPQQVPANPESCSSEAEPTMPPPQTPSPPVESSTVPPPPSSPSPPPSPAPYMPPAPTTTPMSVDAFSSSNEIESVVPEPVLPAPMDMYKSMETIPEAPIPVAPEAPCPSIEEQASSSEVLAEATSRPAVEPVVPEAPYPSIGEQVLNSGILEEVASRPAIDPVVPEAPCPSIEEHASSSELLAEATSRPTQEPMTSTSPLNPVAVTEIIVSKIMELPPAVTEPPVTSTVTPSPTCTPIFVTVTETPSPPPAAVTVTQYIAFMPPFPTNPWLYYPSPPTVGGPGPVVWNTNAIDGSMTHAAPMQQEPAPPTPVSMAPCASAWTNTNI